MKDPAVATTVSFRDPHAQACALLRQSFSRMGRVADVALRRMGDGGVFVDAEEWMLPGL